MAAWHSAYIAAQVRATFLHAAGLLALWPKMGEPSKRPGVHKLLVDVIKDELTYHLYYRVRKRARRIEILIFRNAIRRPLKRY